LPSLASLFSGSSSEFNSYKSLEGMSIKNSKIIKIVPMEIVLTNQYFKIYLNRHTVG